MNSIVTKKKTKKDYQEKLSEARIDLSIAQYETFPQRIISLSKKKKKK